jgi:hypothetical protein
MGFAAQGLFGFVYDLCVLRISEKRRAALPVWKAKKGEAQKDGQNHDATGIRSYCSRSHFKKTFPCISSVHACTPHTRPEFTKLLAV